MGMDDMKHDMEDMKGKAKEKIGDATDNESLQAEGVADQASAKMTKAGEEVKDAFTDDR